MCSFLHAKVTWGQQVHFIWKIIFISRVFQGALLAPQHKEDAFTWKAMQRDSSCSLCPGSCHWMSCVDARRQDPGWKLGVVSLGDTQPCHSWPQKLGAAAVLIPKAALFSTYSISLGSGLLKVGGISSVCQPQTL